MDILGQADEVAVRILQAQFAEAVLLVLRPPAEGNLPSKPLGLRVDVLDVRNSGDTAGDHHRVVGYASIVFY